MRYFVIVKLSVGRNSSFLQNMKFFNIIFSCIIHVTIGIKKPSVVVIGAGPAGIAATTRLLEHNFENIVLLEAEPRIGGRVNSIKFGDAYVELGAEWCHGEKDNIVYDLARSYDIFRHTDSSNLLYHSSGKPVDAQLSDELGEIRKLYYAADGHRSQPGYVTLGEYITNSYNKTVHEKYGHDRRKLNIALDTLDFFMHAILSSEGAFSWFDPAAQSDYKDCEGDLQLNWNGLGYKTVLEILMRKYPDQTKQLPIEDKIHLNKEVVTIRWDRKSKRGVVISCSDGSVYTGDHVIFTPSVGVLKERSSVMFMPRLPKHKVEAIENIGLGAVMKVVMLFSSNWWGSETNFNFVWSEEDRETLLEKFSEGPSLNGRSWLTNLLTAVKVERNPRVLVAWFTGAMVPAIELMPEEHLIDGIYYALNKFLGNMFNITEIEKFTRSQWYSNPHFRGAYSFQTIKSKRGYDGTQRSSEEDLAEPLKDLQNRPVVQFAGEATHPYYYSTVHGAIETGRREADRIINLYYHTIS